jgi:Fe-S cluster assembly protein SufD
VFSTENFVEKEAKTNRSKKANNILLSDKATINAKTIRDFCGCKMFYGCTIGQLENAMFYATTWNSEKEAKALLMYAFSCHYRASKYLN